MKFLITGGSGQLGYDIKGNLLKDMEKSKYLLQVTKR